MHRYEVSDGILGTQTITGYFSSHIEAMEAFERAHGTNFRGAALVYRLCDDGSISCVYESCENGSICESNDPT